MPSSPWIGSRPHRVSGARCALLVTATVLALDACRERGGEEQAPEHRAGASAEAAIDGGPAAPAPAPDVGALAPLLERAKVPGRLSESDRQALEQAMQAVLEPAARACDGCRAAVSYVDEQGNADRFRCDLVGASGEPMAQLELYYRSGLPAGAARAWARSTVAGHPAIALPGEHLFVWPGRFEIRAFGRAASLRAEPALEKLVSGLPLDALAKL